MSSAAKLGLIAGLGDLPVSVYEGVRGQGRDVYVIRIAGFEEPKLTDAPGETIAIGEIGKLFKVFKRENCKEVCFAGIVKRPSFDNLRVDMRGARLLPKVIAAAKKGDDALLSVIVDAIEKEGFSVIGAHKVLAPLTAEGGLIAGPQPSDTNLSDIRKAARIAAMTGAEDIGQGCVVCNGLVLAVEAQEGTDAMLSRCAALPEEIRGTATARRGVLAKRPKPNQERRIDLPTIGVATVEGAASAGLAGIAVEAGGALIIDRSTVIHRAEALGLFIYGFSPEDDDK